MAMTRACLEPARAPEAGRPAAASTRDRLFRRALPRLSSIFAPTSCSRTCWFGPNSPRSASIRSKPRLVRRSARGQPSSPPRQTGRSPRARTASTRPRSISFLTTFCAAPPLRRGGSIAQWSSRCEAADRTIHWVSVSCRRHGRDPPVLRRDPRAVTTAAPLRYRAGGGQAVTPGRRHYRSVRSRMPVLSATIFDAVFVRVGFGTCRLGLITGWLPVRVLPAPPRSPALTPSSPSPRNTLDLPRFWGGCNGPFAVSAGRLGQPAVAERHVGDAELFRRQQAAVAGDDRTVLGYRDRVGPAPLSH